MIFGKQIVRKVLTIFMLVGILMFIGTSSAYALSNGAEARTTNDYYYSDDSAVGPTPTYSSNSNWECTVNGQPTDCADAKKAIGGAFLALMIVFFVFIAFVSIIGFVVWLIMLIHAISNPIKDKALWIILMVFVGTLASIIYYFVVKRPFDKQNKQGQPVNGANSVAAAPVTVENNKPMAQPQAVVQPPKPSEPKKPTTDDKGVADGPKKTK